ncbi:RNA polymerase sigma factor [Alicyclobacillus shizuokensis]|uniref:RNA polymerase sigma factor n=1 Tax=Alicyclobacillus shizuokensis TaxID=392014 RepID=UPI000835FD9A|nr:RNA polymerase sigma factor [Alicyclobacillus shizuokensis]
MKNHVPMSSSGQPESSVCGDLSAVRDHLLRYCECLSGSRQEAEDVAQATLLKALPVLQGKSHPNMLALLRRIAKNTWIDHVRKQRKCHPLDPAQLSALCGSMPPEEHVGVEAALQVLIQRLTPKQRAVFLLCTVFQYADREAAELLGMTRGAVKAMLHRAKRRLASVTKMQPATDHDVQKEVLQAYVAAFHAADTAALIQLCLGDAFDPVPATSKVLISARRPAVSSTSNGLIPMSVLAA